MSVQTELPLQPTSIMVLNAEVGARRNIPLMEDFLAKKRTSYFNDHMILPMDDEIPMHELDVDLVRTQAFMCEYACVVNACAHRRTRNIY